MGVKFQAGIGINMLDINFSNLLYGTPEKSTSSTYALEYGGGYKDVFEGRGFKYDRDGIPKGGTVEDFTEYRRSKELFEISGLDVSAKSIVKAAFTGDTTDDALLILKAMRGSDKITGSNGNDTLFAAAGNDKMNGRAGNDIMLSGPGADTMKGGAGADAFVFLDASHSTVSVLGRDTISDFSDGDIIHLSNIGSGQFIGTSAFTGTSGDVRYDIEGTNTVVYADFSGDGVADFSVRLKGAMVLNSDDFLI